MSWSFDAFWGKGVCRHASEPPITHLPSFSAVLIGARANCVDFVQLPSRFSQKVGGET